MWFRGRREFNQYTWPAGFCKEIDRAGVFLCLNIDGTLHVSKTSGDLSLIQKSNKTILLASNLDFRKYKRQLEAFEGWYVFDKNGFYRKHKKKDNEYDNEDPVKKSLKYIGEPVVSALSNSYNTSAFHQPVGSFSSGNRRFGFFGNDDGD